MKSCLLKFREFTDPRGTLVPVEAERQIPFPIRRVYWIDANIGTRGDHAHRSVDQVFVVLEGTVLFEVHEDGVVETFTPETLTEGVYIPAMVWHRFHTGKEGAIILALASDYYDESDYIRDYHEWERLVRK